MTYSLPHIKTRWLYWLVFALLCFTFLPWLGLTLFNTKGEPREAIVAWSMLATDNWILPQSCGGDIPYKPPFMAWLIAIFSWIFGGVTEYTSRLPSALAVIALGMATLRFYLKHTSNQLLAFLTMGVTVTAFEMFRAGVACRVDMVLTACMVISMYMMFDGPRVRFWPIVLMTCAVLTKGPIGACLPCLVLWLYYLLTGHRFWASTLPLMAMGALSLVVPALWYYAATSQGGAEFVRLAIEENLGRLTGTMSYDSHANPLYYNFVSVIAGMCPWTLVALFSLFTLHYHTAQGNIFTSSRNAVLTIKKGFQNLTPENRFSLVVVLVILGFYCIPESKRSVYLLPIYPFLSYYVAKLLLWMRGRGIWLKAYNYFLAILGSVIPILLLTIKYGPVQDYIKNLPASTAGFMLGLHLWDFNAVTWFLMIILVLLSLLSFSSEFGKPYRLVITVMVTFAIYWNYSATVAPAILNTKSDITLAYQIDKVAPTGPVYTYISDPLMRYYTANFYTGDRLVPYHGQTIPDGSTLIVSDKDYPKFLNHYGHRWTAMTVLVTSKKSCDTRHKTMIMRLRKQNPTSTTAK